MSNGRRRTYSPEISADIEAKLAAGAAQLDALAAWACDQYDDGDEQFGRRAGVARGRELLAERDQLRTALRETREALKPRIYKVHKWYDGNSNGTWTCRECGGRGQMDEIVHLHLCPVAVLARHAALAEGGASG